MWNVTLRVGTFLFRDDDGDDVTGKAGTGFSLELEGPGLEVRLALLKTSSTTPTKVLEPLKEYYKTQ